MSTAMDPEKEHFLKEFGDDYGYPNAEKNIDEIRNTEFKRLGDMVYLDHAGATLYSESQMDAVFKDFNSTVFGNPHSQSDSSFNTSDRVGEARRQVLNFFKASPQEYSCIFTSGATAALKLIGESFPWNSSSTFMYTVENHNSVLGIREYAFSKGAAAVAVDIEEGLDHETSGSLTRFQISQRSEQRRAEAVNTAKRAGDVYNLFAFPSECNFSGMRLNLDLVKIFKEDADRALESWQQYRGRWMVLIDAAKGCATEALDLSRFKPDFVVVSFYKLFGYPTGLGALIIRNDAAKLLKKTYFSGGTVAVSIADADFVKSRAGIEEYFEDGTIPYLSIASIVHGFKILNSLTMSAISRHTSCLATYVRKQLSDMKHENGNRVCLIYGPNSKVPIVGIGPTITFNLLRPDGSWFGYREVEKLASLSGIQLRTGCFCNPGACAKFVGLSHSDLISNFEVGHVCWDDHDVLLGKPTGAVRASFGYMSTFEDAKKFLNFVKVSFVSLAVMPPNCILLKTRISSPADEDEGCGRTCSKYSLKSISIYPIKSCMGFNVSSWPVTGTGLLYDREWILRSTSGEILTQKKVLDLCYIKTYIDLNLSILEVESPRCEEKLQIKLNSDLLLVGKEEMDINGQRIEVHRYHNQVDAWFSNAIGRTCTLLRRGSMCNYGCLNRNSSPGMCRDLDGKMNFVNEAQFLMVSEESIADLNHRLKEQKGLCEEAIQVSPLRFRPNLVVSGGEAYAEDGWRSIRIGDKHFTSMGGCNRCQMINLSVKGGKVQRLREPLSTLGTYRRVKGKITFGILLRYDVSDKMETDTWLHVGEEICPTSDCGLTT